MSDISFKGWLLITAIVIIGGALEYCWMVGFNRLNQRWNRRQKTVWGSVLIAVAVAGLLFGIIRFYHP